MIGVSSTAQAKKGAVPNAGSASEFIALMSGVLVLVGSAVTISFNARSCAVAGCNSPDKEYQEAIYATIQPSADWASQALFKFDRPTTFVTWTVHDRVAGFKPANPNEIATAKGDIWVADAASLKRFCQDYVRQHPGDEQALVMRLRQRLGLPPGVAKDTFVELQVDPAKGGRMFRPCGDPTTRVDASTCSPPVSFPRESDVWDGKQGTGVNEALQEWRLRRYYSSFASANQYPWTELGYTFDWARAEDGSGAFVRRGETEFVIPKGDAINFVSATPTTAYCAPD